MKCVRHEEVTVKVKVKVKVKGLGAVSCSGLAVMGAWGRFAGFHRCAITGGVVGVGCSWSSCQRCCHLASANTPVIQTEGKDLTRSGATRTHWVDAEVRFASDSSLPL